VRVSIFELNKLLTARARRLRQGLPSRFDFDAAEEGPYMSGQLNSPAWDNKEGEPPAGQLPPARAAASTAPVAQGAHGEEVEDLEPSMVDGDTIEPTMDAALREQPKLHKATGRQHPNWRRRAAVIAGQESGCRFYFIVHSAFVDGARGAYDVPINMMDKACKDKRGFKYRADGVATLRFDTFESDRSLIQVVAEEAPEAAHHTIALQPAL